MDLRQLKFFLEVAHSEGFTKAAERLHIAQSALSIAIKKLEDELEVELFNRRNRRVSLTAEGEALAFHAKEIFQGVARARQEIADLRGLLKGEVRVGLTPMLSSFFFPKIISSFKQRYPALQISIDGESAGTIQRKIETGEIDMGIIAGSVPEGLDSHHLVREEVVAAVCGSHPYAKMKKCALDKLLSEPMIQFKSGYYLREMIDELAAKEGIAPLIMAESNLFYMVRNLVKEELGLAFLLKMAVAKEADLAVVSCDPPLFLDLFIAWKKNGRLSPANRAFVNYLIQEVDEYYQLIQAAGTFPLP
ncbi:transcriptional regulator, LysR family [Geoalkalibacter ferrihydriticus]|uniref:LysR family transcriptional regulator n=2 Tax=Geoalkalibacter ferrihydriticus TaxID=392333 RepID=A0A0C2HQR7_9BACT|nr:LysR family transcriptional regulator [Geoalkalibacter ferrihydriticus]KIH77235.1 LysR family transcriptional regulator [Geoalkalibacter ferrihydriticus DSM 17813]SDM24215.1 transcriptional regulator, LysR family [Geoalkalibacter ferrihydriticus]